LSHHEEKLEQQRYEAGHTAKLSWQSREPILRTQAPIETRIKYPHEVQAEKLNMARKEQAARIESDKQLQQHHRFDCGERKNDIDESGTTF